MFWWSAPKKDELSVFKFDADENKENVPPKVGSNVVNDKSNQPKAVPKKKTPKDLILRTSTMPKRTRSTATLNKNEKPPSKDEKPPSLSKQFRMIAEGTKKKVLKELHNI